MRDTVERERRARGTDGRPFAYYVRPHTVEPEDVQGFVDAGFDNIVLWGPNCWSNDPAVPLEQKVESLERVARTLGVKRAEAA